METSTITIEHFKEYGMKECDDPVTPLEKVIGSGEDGELRIVITREYNTNALALRFPDGATLFLNCNTIEELKAFEKCIGMWTPNY